MKRACVAVVVVLALVAAAGYGAEPPGKPDDASLKPPIQTPAEGTPMGLPEQMLSGSVTDAAGQPLGGVAIKLFADGSLAQVAHTAASGAYEMQIPLNLEKDQTVVLWFVSTSEPLMPKPVVLKESSAARSGALFSPCTLEVKMRPQMRVDVKLLTENEELASLKAKGCLSAYGKSKP
jgi:hypothetical protein